VYALLGSLFLSRRAFPGTIVPPAETWVLAGAIPGYLIPWEVRLLARHLDSIAEVATIGDNPMFQLFADRVRRAAKGWLGLVTILEGL
jgi:hypothetical protein